MIDLAVAYRIYPGISKSPAFFPSDKLRLSEMCLKSFHGAISGLRARIWALLDGCPPEYDALFRQMFQDQDVEIVSLNKIGNFATFSRQIDLLLKQTEAPFAYFAEDDYLYSPGALTKMISFMRNNPDADFVTPYDHPDQYRSSSRFERHLIRPYGDRYWRTASSTCLTFLTSRKTLLETARMFRTYSLGNMDCPIWLALTQRAGLANVRVHFHDWLRTKTWVKVWFWGLRQVLFSRQYRLWAPMPALATHMESTDLAPVIDWQSAFLHYQRQEEKW
jgi:hypothetical protein